MEDPYKPNKEGEGLSGAFNMAFDTLMRLGEILRNIKTISSMPLKPSETQPIKINLVKQFFIQASPLLKEEVVNKYKNEIFSIKPLEKDIVDPNTHKIWDHRISYSPDIDNKLDMVVLDIQRELQKEGKYMMPSKSDPRFNWKQE